MQDGSRMTEQDGKPGWRREILDKPLYGGLWPNLGARVRQPHIAKELLCGNQPADLSLVIAVFAFSVLFRCFAALVWHNKEGL